jgi:Uma2 family endonuclease
VYGSRLHFELAAFVNARGVSGVVLLETGFKLRSDPDTVRAPDVSFVAAARLHPGPLPEKYWDGAPDLAVEVLSPGERLRAVEAKVREYLGCGARAVWVVRPRTRTVSTYHRGEAARIFTEDDTLEDRSVLPGFRYPLRSLFAGLPPARR